MQSVIYEPKDLFFVLWSSNVQPGSVSSREASAFLGKLPFGDFPHERAEG